MTVVFNFIIGAAVITPFSEPGLISMAAIDDGGIQYCVVTKHGSSWYKEDQLSQAD